MSESEIVRDFLVESYENLDRLDRDLVGLEKNPHNPDALAGVFRTIHTIKGTCGFLGFGKLEKVAHVGENLLTRLRDGQLTLNPERTTALLGMVDAVRQMLKEIEATDQDGENDYPELRETLTRLQTPVAGDARSEGAQAVASLCSSAPVETKTLEKIEPAASSEKESEMGKNAPALTEAVPEVQIQKNLVQQDLAQASQVQSLPASRRRADDPARKPSRGKIGGVLVERGMVQAADLALALQEQEKGDRRRLGEILVALGLAKPEDVAAAQQIVEAKQHDAATETIRVGVNVLDKLMTLVGELVLARNQLLQISNTVEDTGLQAVSQRMNLIATELQEEVMKTRMQPIGNIWAQFPRTVRDVALGCGKEVGIEMEGKETELDKTIIEAIKDPLTHLVRNSVDHGIELPEARVQAGKARAGRLILRAFHEGGQVNIEISDDGAGLSGERIRKKAIERGVVTAEQATRMTEREVFNLIFLPGFSTAEKVTNVSGRGVGMDVVKTNVEKIGGLVDLQSTLGRGTTVRVKIPLTLAIIPALVVTCSGERYAIPQVNLLELVRLEAEDARTAIEMVHGVPVYRLRGRLLPLVYLNRELKLEENGHRDGTSNSEDAVNIVVLQADDRQFGLVVDEINDTEEIVVKPLRKQLKTVKTFAGSSIMGDGKVALILDVLGLAQRANVVSEARERTVTGKAADSAEKAGEKQTFLLFAGLGDSRMAIPLNTLARLEEFPASQVEMSGNEWVTQYRGQILPLVRLAVVLEERRPRLRVLQAPPAPDSGPLQVLVMNHESGSFGLVVERILDIVEARADVKSKASRAAVLYSVVIGERVTELLDIPAILQIAGVNATHSGAPTKSAGVAN
jgi:two-component system, chemotaxis family, sensor kinase CheA